MPDVPDERKLFGRVLVEAGLISEYQLETALEVQKEQGGRIGYNLVRLGYLTPRQLSAFLQDHFGVGVISEDLAERQKAANVLPRHLALYYKIAPIKVTGTTLTIAVSEIEHPNLVQILSDISGYKIDPLIYPEAEIRGLVDSGYRLPGQSGVEFFASSDNVFVLIDTQKGIKALASAQLKNEPDAGEWLRSIIAEAIKEKSREILIQPESEGAQVLFKKETFLPSEFTLNSSLQDDMTFFLYRLSRMNPIDQHRTQHGRFAVKIHDRKIAMVVSAFPTIYGVRFLLEMFDEKLLKHSYEELTHASPAWKEHVENFVLQSSHGMFVITGPDGSGRTTFLYSLLSRCKERFRHIMTLENSVRYPIGGISQAEVREEIMEGALENILKQKPDLVAVDALRSARAAEIAFLIAARVPLIAVMPCYDSYIAIDWFCRHNLRSAIKAGLLHTVLSPRLLPRVCPNCAVAFELSPEERQELGAPENAELKTNQGCDFCQNPEEQAADRVFEFLRVENEVLSWIEENHSPSVLRHKARQSGRKALLDLVLPQAFSGELDILSVLKLKAIL